MKRTGLLFAVALLPVVLPGCVGVDESAAIAAAEAPRTPDVKDPIGKWEVYVGGKRFYRMTDEELLAYIAPHGAVFDARKAVESYRKTSFAKRREIGLAFLEVSPDDEEATQRLAKKASRYFADTTFYAGGCCCGRDSGPIGWKAFQEFIPLFLLDGVVLDASLPREQRLQAVRILEKHYTCPPLQK